MWRKYGESILALLIFALALTAGWGYLRNDAIKVRPDATPDDFTLLPVLLWTTGHGLSLTLDPLPQCQAFLNQQEDRLDPSAIPADVTCFPDVGKFEQDRQNLHYLVGLVWRVFGISWSNLKGMLAVVFALIAVLSYGIFRLGMNRLLSIAGVVLTMSSPIMLHEAPWLRSVCKAPFILASILIIGWMLTRRLRPGALLSLALLNGIVIGIGFGFRQDPVICLPPALAAAALGARLTAEHGLRYRLLACFLMLAAFTVSAWPSLRMTHDTGGNNSFYLTQGFSARCFEDAGLLPPFYTVAATTEDHQIHALITDYARKQDKTAIDNLSSARAMGLAHFTAMLQCAPDRAICDLAVEKLLGNIDDMDLWSKQAELAARRLTADLYKTFPADVVARWYGAVLRVVQGLRLSLSEAEDSAVYRAALDLHGALGDHLDRYGHWYAFFAIVIVSARSFWMALCMLMVLLYFSGYTSLEFQMRHAFHLNLLAFWFPLFLLGLAGRALCHARAVGRHSIIASARSARAWFRPALRMAGFGAAAVLVLALPLWAARVYQQDRVREIHDRLVRAELEPVPFEVTRKEGETLCMPGAFPGFAESVLDKTHELLASWGIPAAVGPVVRSEYVALDIECTGNVAELMSQKNPIRVCRSLPETVKGNLVRVFIPVFKYSDSFIARQPSTASVAFDGFRLGNNVSVKRMYWVRTAKDFPVLLTACLPLEGQETRCCYELPSLFRWNGTLGGHLIQRLRARF